MWTREELKSRAKGAFKANYWKSVLVALILVFMVSGLSLYHPSVARMPSASNYNNTYYSSYEPDDVNVEIKDGKITVDVDDESGEKVHVNVDADDIEDLHDVLESIEANVDEEDVEHVTTVFGPGIALIGISAFLALLAVIALAIAIYALLFCPLEVGAQRFFIRNLHQRAEVKEVAFGYDNNYKEIVKTIFLRSLFVFLWSLLLIIPGIYKSYEYRMIPYLLAEDPTMTKERAFSESRRMMDGQKWNAFVLDLSFLGWNILSALTFGILGVFYVYPYQTQTNAALYEKLRYGLPSPEQVQQPAPVGPAAPMASAYDPTIPMTSSPMATAPMATVPISAAPVAVAAATVPVIVSESQPPVPPFAQVGAEPTFDLDETAPVEEANQVDATDQVNDASLVDATASLDADQNLEEPAALEIANSLDETAPIEEACLDDAAAPVEATTQISEGAEENITPDSPEA